MKKVLIFILVLETLIIGKVLALGETGEIEAGILREDYSGIISREETLLSGLRGHDLARAQYFLGLAYLKTGEFAKARKYFNAALKIGADDSLNKDIETAIADSYFTENDYDNALIYYKKFLDTYRKTNREYIVKYKMARTCLELGQWNQAKSLLKEVAGSSSLEAQKAREILEENLFYFTAQVGSFQDRKNARNLLKRLKKEKFDCFITETTCDKITCYRIRVGKFETKAEVEKIAAVLKEKGLPVRIYP